MTERPPLTTERQSSHVTKWRKIPGATRYYISDKGQILSRARGPSRILTPSRDRKGYLRQYIVSDIGPSRPRKVHQLVMLAFVGPRPDGFVVCHNNGDPSDNRLENLRYGTRSDNCQDSVAHGTFPASGRRNYRAVLCYGAVQAIFLRRQRGETTYQLAASFGVGVHAIRKVLRRATWAAVPELVGLTVKEAAR